MNDEIGESLALFSLLLIDLPWKFDRTFDDVRSITNQCPIDHSMVSDLGRYMILEEFILKIAHLQGKLRLTSQHICIDSEILR